MQDRRPDNARLGCAFEDDRASVRASDAVDARQDDPLVLRLVEFDSVSSTNDLIKQAIENGADEGLVVRADTQEGGYGRYGRAWSSPKGGLYMSVLLDPASHIEDTRESATKLPTLSLLTSLAVRDAIVDEMGEGFSEAIKIKWPNDILFVGDDDGSMFRKLCGISVEMHKGVICIGIGVNVDRSEEDEGARLDPPQDEPRRNSPAFLSELAAQAALDDIGGRSFICRLCRKVADRLFADYAEWISLPFESFKERYNSKLALIGLNVRIEDSKATVRTEGEVLGIDDRGCLLVRTPDGSVECVSSGEAHVSLVQSS